MEIKTHYEFTIGANHKPEYVSESQQEVYELAIAKARETRKTAYMMQIKTKNKNVIEMHTIAIDKDGTVRRLC